jgi:hypothetical protein
MFNKSGATAAVFIVLTDQDSSTRILVVYAKTYKEWLFNL